MNRISLIAACRNSETVVRTALERVLSQNGAKATCLPRSAR